MSRDLDSAIRAGWVAESGIKGEFYIVDKAAQVLESGFEPLRGQRGNGQKSRTSNAKTSRKAKTTKPTPEAFKDIDAISPTLDGLIDYHRLTKKKDKFLWAINAAKVLGVNSVSNQEIVWLTDRLGEGIPANNISGNFQPNKNSGYINRSLQDDKIRITPGGEEYLRSLGR